MSTLTLGEAAKLTGKSKPTISNAVKSGKISGIKDEKTGVFQIEKSELIRVYPEKSSSSTGTKSYSVQQSGSAVAALEKKHLEEKVAELEARLSKTEDKLEIAEVREREANARVFALIEDKSNKSLWQRIRGK
jgi:excisionase family DNA binding protein